MLLTSDDPGDIRLLSLLPECASDVSNVCSLEEFTLQTCPEYEVLEYLAVQDDNQSSTILINGEPITIDITLDHALTHLKRRGGSLKFWIECLCLNPPHTPSPKLLSQLHKVVRTNAERVIIWIGRDHEDNDVLRGYLGRGNALSTESAFYVCQSIANVEDPQEDLSPLLEVKAEHSHRAMWCHLANILYRPWFRELPLLRTNYLDEIPSLLVWCGTRLIEWESVRVSAERIRIIRPIPRLLGEDWMTVFDSESHVKDWVDAREYFGFSTMHLMNQGVWFVNKLLEKPSDNDTSISNLRGLVPIIAEIMGTSREKLPAISRSLTDTKRIENAREHSPITLAGLQDLEPFPTLPIRRALIPSPDPQYQAPYVHRPFNGSFSLLKLFPHGSESEAPVQGSIIEAPPGDIPPFMIVVNATLQNYRRNSLIIVDGQSFQIPEALELFLRRVRDTEHESLLFIWRMCWDPAFADMPWDSPGPGELGTFFSMARSIASKSAGAINMYEVLIEAAEEVVQKPVEGSDGYDWLLDLLDEAQVNALPVTEQSQEEDRQRYDLLFQTCPCTPLNRVS